MFKSPYPRINQTEEESMPGEALDETKNQEFGGEVNYTPEVPHYDEGGVVPTQLPGMGPEVNPDDFDKYLGNARQEGDKYGPQEQIALENQLQSSRRSPLNITGHALSTLGDSLMQGVAGAGNPGFEAGLQNKEQNISNERLGTLKSAHEQQMQEVHNHMGLDAKDPSSALSKNAQRSYGPLLEQLGLTKDDVLGMSADLIGDVAAKRVSAEDARSRVAESAAYHQADLGLRGKAQEDAAAKAKEEEEAKALAELNKRGSIRRGAEALFPSLQTGETKKLKEKAGIDAHPPASVITATNPKTGHKITSTDGGKTWQ